MHLAKDWPEPMYKSQDVVYIMIINNNNNNNNK